MDKLGTGLLTSTAAREPVESCGHPPELSTARVELSPGQSTAGLPMVIALSGLIPTIHSPYYYGLTLLQEMDFPP